MVTTREDVHTLLLNMFSDARMYPGRTFIATAKVLELIVKQNLAILESLKGTKNMYSAIKPLTRKETQ